MSSLDGLTPSGAVRDAFTLRRRPPAEKFVDQGFRWLTLSLAGVVAVVLAGIFFTVLHGAQEAFKDFGLGFLLTSAWDPVNNKYGAFTAIYGTLVTSLLSLLIAVPLGLGTAIFITEELIPPFFCEAIGLMVELLAAIPSVVLGLWAIFVMEPMLRPLLGALHAYLGWFPLFSTVPQGPGVAPAVLILVVRSRTTKRQHRWKLTSPAVAQAAQSLSTSSLSMCKRGHQGRGRDRHLLCCGACCDSVCEGGWLLWSTR